MTDYKIEIIPGTQDFVKAELKAKHHNCEILELNSDFINFQAPESLIETFDDIRSGLRITKSNGLVRNLFRRSWRKKTSPAGINPALAYVLCAAAELNSEDVVYDPFCGGGTIIITAALEFPVQKVLASDLSGKAVDMTLENFNFAGVSPKKFAVFRSNISQVKLQKASVSKVITNLPFGIRSGNHEKNVQAYKSLFRQMAVFLKKDGLAILYTQEKNLIETEYKNSKAFLKLDQFAVETDGLMPTVYVFKKVI